jgi:hypothetical protein
MAEEEEIRDRKRANDSESKTDIRESGTGDKAIAITGILDERIQNLREAIEEIDEALAGRKVLNRRFLEQIEREAAEVKGYLDMLQPPWRMGFHPDIEFMRLSLHKSLTSRAKDHRTEELKYWENGVNLTKERRKFFDEYKALLATRRRLSGI